MRLGVLCFCCSSILLGFLHDLYNVLVHILGVAQTCLQVQMCIIFTCYEIPHYGISLLKRRLTLYIQVQPSCLSFQAIMYSQLVRAVPPGLFWLQIITGDVYQCKQSINSSSTSCSQQLYLNCFIFILHYSMCELQSLLYLPYPWKLRVVWLQFVEFKRHIHRVT